MKDKKPNIFIVDSNGNIKNIEDVQKEQKEKGRIDTRLLEPGSVVKVETKNSIYELKFIDPEKGRCLVRGGRLNDWKEGVLNGSTWGGSMIQVAHLGIDMHMEFGIIGKMGATVTSPVKSITVINTIKEEEQ